MEKSVALVLLLLSLSYASLGEDASIKKKPGREPRNYDNIFGEYESYQIPDDTQRNDKPVYSDAGSKKVKPQQDKKQYTSYDSFQGYDQNLPSYPGLYKGYPYYPQFNTKLEFPDVSPDQMMQMMAMMNSMKMLQDTKENNTLGFFGNLISNPKALFVAAILPVSIMIASFIPLIVNYFMTGVSLPTVISSTANNKMGRSLNGTNYLDTVLENIGKYGEKLLESEKCVEETICSFIIDDSDNKGTDYFQRTAKVVANIIKLEWLGETKAAMVLSGIKQRNCTFLCETDRKKQKNFPLM